MRVATLSLSELEMSRESVNYHLFMDALVSHPS
jgi:hypothetical protein